MKHQSNQAVVQIITKLELGGAQKVCLSVLDGIQQESVPAYLISGTNGPLAHTMQKKEWAFLLPEFKREISIKQLATEIKNFIAITKILRKLKKKHPSLIVHTHSTKAGLIGRWAAFFARVPYRVHTIHGYGFNDHQQPHAWLTTYILELLTSLITTRYICVSSADVKTGKRLFPYFAKKHTIIRAAIDWEQFYQAAKKIDSIEDKKDKNPFIFGTVSCFKKQKNLFDLLRAFEYVHQTCPNTQLHMVGDGELRIKIEIWIKSHNLQHAIILHGWQSRVAPIMSQWHAFVMSSLWEGLPCAIVEARMLKLPILSYKTGGIPDIIKHNENGFLYNQKDWNSLAAGMIKIIKNPHIHEHLSSYNDDLHEFNDSYMVKEHINLYKQLQQ